MTYPRESLYGHLLAPGSKTRHRQDMRTHGIVVWTETGEDRLAVLWGRAPWWEKVVDIDIKPATPSRRLRTGWTVEESTDVPAVFWAPCSSIPVPS